MKTKNMNKKIMSFRCENTTAQLLEQMAQSKGKSISELLTELVQKGIDAPVTEQQLKDQLDVYEAGTTGELFEKYKGQKARFFDDNGNEYFIELKEKKDVQIIYHHTFKAFQKYRQKYGDNYM